MKKRVRSVLVALTAVATACFAPSVVAGKAHRHGVAELSLALEASSLEIELVFPLDTLLGFERAPRTSGERQAAAGVLKRFREGEGLLLPDADADCRLHAREVVAPVLEGGDADADGHARMEVRYGFRCERPSALRAVDVALFDSFRRLERIEGQLVLSGGQRKVTLNRKNRMIPVQPSASK